MTEQEFGTDLFKKDLKEALLQSKWEDTYLSNRELAKIMYSSFYKEDIINIIKELKILCKNQEQTSELASSLMNKK
jgi:hypothetical protein